MDIHKPKPWHGVREFLKEYVIIVVSVLTALALEQVAEWFHWRHMAEQHEADMRRSAQIIALYAVERVVIADCVAEPLQHAAEALRAPGAAWKGLNPGASGRANEYMPVALRPPTRAWPIFDWESTLNDGTLAHMAPDKRRTYASIFRTSSALVEQQNVLSALTPDLAPLIFDRTLSPDDKARYLGVVVKVAEKDALIEGMARSALRVISQEGIWPSDEQLRVVMKLNREHLGACVHDVNRADFLVGGRYAHVLPGLR